MHRLITVPILLLSAAFVTAVSPVALAQPTDRPTVFAAGAVHRLWNDESSIGVGIAAGGGVSAPLPGRFVVRARVMRSHNRRDFDNGVVFETDATRYTAEALWKFSDGPHAAYAGIGGGAFAFDHESEFGPNPQDPRRTGNETVQRFKSSGTEFIWGGIAGFTALSRGRFRVQPEISTWVSRGYHIVIEGAVLAGWVW